MPQITVNVYANLREYTGGASSVDLEVEPGQTVGDLVDRLGIPRDKTKIIFVNNKSAKFDDPLEGEERIDLFSAIGGG
jgi:molybdopterin converting factor small subunit